MYVYRNVDIDNLFVAIFLPLTFDSVNLMHFSKIFRIKFNTCVCTLVLTCVIVFDDLVYHQHVVDS